MIKICFIKKSNKDLLRIFKQNVEISKNVFRKQSRFINNDSRLWHLKLINKPLSQQFYKIKHFSSAASSQDLYSIKLYDNEDLSDKLFDLISENDTVSCAELRRSLSSCGLWHNDPRLEKFYDRLQNRKKTTIMPTFYESDRLNRDTFKWLIDGSEHIIRKALCDDFVIPDFNRFCKVLNEIYRDCRTNWKGMLSHWPLHNNKSLPNLNYGGSGSDYWGVSVCTVDGQRHSMGDVDVYFPLHSCSWPFNYAFSVKQFGSDEVHRFVGNEAAHHSSVPNTPSSSLSPMNPLSIAGSLLISSLLYRNVHDIEKRYDKLLNDYEKLTGGDDQVRVRLNDDLFDVAFKGSHHLKSVAHSLAHFDSFPRGACLDEILSMHLKSSCLEVDVRTLALMAAYLANGGHCPISLAPLLQPSTTQPPISKHDQHHSSMTRNTLAFMYSSSAFSRSIRLPISTSLTGAIIVVVNGVLGMCLWSPPLNEDGISSRGVQFCNELIKRFNLQDLEIKITEFKVDPRVRRSFNKTAHIGELLFAAHRGDESSIHNMHKSGLRLEACDYDGRTALHVSSCEGNLECVKYLLDKCNVEIEPLDRWGRSPLDEAIKFGRLEVQKFLNGKINNQKD